MTSNISEEEKYHTCGTLEKCSRSTSAVTATTARQTKKAAREIPDKAFMAIRFLDSCFCQMERICSVFLMNRAHLAQRPRLGEL